MDNNSETVKIKLKRNLNSVEERNIDRIAGHIVDLLSKPSGSDGSFMTIQQRLPNNRTAFYTESGDVGTDTAPYSNNKGNNVGTLGIPTAR